MDPQEMKREQQREESNRFLDEADKGGAVKDIVEYKKDLREKNIDHSNAHSEMRTYMSKRGNINTFIGETYKEAANIESDIEQAKSNDRQLQGYIDDGWIPLQIHQDQQEVIEKYKKILQYMEQQDQIQMILLREVYEEMEKMRGADIAKEIMDEVKQFLNETFEQKFDSDKEKMKIVQETLDDQIEGLEDKIERRVENVREEVNEFDEREKKMLYFMAQNMNAMNNMAEQFQREIDTRESLDKVPNEIAERMKELGVFRELDEDLMKNLDQKNIDTDSQDEDTEVDEEQVIEEQNGSSGQGEGDKKEVETSDDEEEDSQGDSETSDYTEDVNGTPDESDEEENEDQKLPSPQSQKLVHKIPHGEAERVVDVAKAIGEGYETKEEIRDHLDTNNPALPTTQIKTMLKEGYVEKDDIPEDLVPDLDE